MSRLSRLFAVVLLAIVAAHAGAQGLPGAGALPAAPGNSGLPGIDNRQCGTSKWSALCAVGRWAQFSAMDVQVKTGGFSARYQLDQAANGDLHATYREDGGARRRGGEVVVFGVDGIAYRTRDVLPAPDIVIDYLLSSPIMMSKLVVVLLDLGVLDPPADVTKLRAINAGSATQFVRTDAPRLAALYGPPWSMSGTIKPTDDGRLAFALRFRFRPVDVRGVLVPGKTDLLELTGTVSFAPMRPELPGTFDLVGWKLMRRDAPLPGVNTLEEARTAVGS
jgi:hypothetical protein